MSDRLLALAGPGSGPTLSTKNLQEPTVNIRGLVSGSVTIITDGEPQTFDTNGNFDIVYSDWMMVVAEGDCKNLICMIRGKT